MEAIFFNGWFALLRTAVVGVLAYAALVLFLRVSGKRTLAKMNAFDLVVTVSLGSTLATINLSANVALAQGLLALALLIALQFVMTWSIRSGIRYGPTLVTRHCSSGVASRYTVTGSGSGPCRRWATNDSLDSAPISLAIAILRAAP